MSDWKKEAIKENDWKEESIPFPDATGVQMPDLSNKQLEAFGEGALAGATFDFSDEIKAGVKAGLQSLKGKKFKSAYKSQLKKERNELKRLEQEFPWLFGAGELAGGVASGFVAPGGSAAKGVNLLGRGVKAAASLLPEAALQAAGASEEEAGSLEFFKDVGKGSAYGVAGGVALGKVGKGVKKALDSGIFKKATLVTSNLLFDLPPAYAEKLLNPKTAEKIINPKNANELVDGIEDLTIKMGKQAKGLSIAANKHLTTDKTIPVDDLMIALDNLPMSKKIELSSMSKGVGAKKELSKVAETITSFSDGENISPYELKQVIAALDEEIPWDKTDWGPKERLLSEIRGYIDHNILKTNPKYKEAMEPVAELTGNLQDIRRAFAMKRDGYVVKPTDQTYSRVKNFFDISAQAKKPVTEKSLQTAERYFPEDKIGEDLLLSQIAARTEGGVTQGSRNTLFGGGTGAGIGLLLRSPEVATALGIGGLIIGQIKDKYGRKVGKSVLPAASKAISSADVGLQKIAPAFQRGGEILGRQRAINSGVLPQENNQSPLIPRR
jgi:hypothetical protein